jgi:hypothetical protein
MWPQSKAPSSPSREQHAHSENRSCTGPQSSRPHTETGRKAAAQKPVNHSGGRDTWRGVHARYRAEARKTLQLQRKRIPNHRVRKAARRSGGVISTCTHPQGEMQKPGEVAASPGFNQSQHSRSKAAFPRRRHSGCPTHCPTHQAAMSTSN